MEEEFKKVVREKGYVEIPLEEFDSFGRKLELGELDGRVITIEKVELRQSAFNPQQTYVVATGRLGDEKVYLATASRQVVNVLTKAAKFAPLLVQFQVLKIRGRQVLRIRNIAVANPPK